jgi:hypothetical protein
MKVRAIAIASAEANVVGTVELQPSAMGLTITYVDAVSLSEPGAPIAFESGQQITVAWCNVSAARHKGVVLWLELRLLHGGSQRLMLVHFSVGQQLSPQLLHHRRLLVRLWAVGVGAVLVVLSALGVPRLSPTLGPLAGLGIGSLFAAAIYVVACKADTWLSDGGQKSQLTGELFISDLLAYLPQIPVRPPARQPWRPRWPNLQGILPRTTLAISLTLAGALLAALIMIRWTVTARDDSAPAEFAVARSVAAPDTPPAAERKLQPASQVEPLAEPVDSAKVAAAPAAAPGLATTPTAKVAGPCQCERPESLLWGEPLPRVSLIVLSSRRYQRHHHDHIELDFAAINNSDTDVAELTSMVEFFDQEPAPSSKLTSISTRAVYYQGPLRSGEAIKWHVDADGSTFRIHPPAENGVPIAGTIGDNGEHAASANAIARLLKAHNRPVRLHAAMLLGFLNDPQARDAALQLGDSLRETESTYLRRLVEALGDLRTCKVQVSGEGQHRHLNACVYNTIETPRTPVELVVRALDAKVTHTAPVAAPPEVLVERSVILPGSIAAKSGVLAQVDFDLAGIERAPAAFEAFAQVAAAH